MADIGFVYILTNPCMPGLYKVGCTERAPHARAEELSRPTGVPAPFKVACYIECYDFQSCERRVHEWLSQYRVSTNREFFDGAFEYAVRLLFWLPGRLSFVEPLAPGEPGLLHDFSQEYDFDGAQSWHETPCPFVKPNTAEKPPALGFESGKEEKAESKDEEANLPF